MLWIVTKSATQERENNTTLAQTLHLTDVKGKPSKPRTKITENSDTI